MIINNNTKYDYLVLFNFFIVICFIYKIILL